MKRFSKYLCGFSLGLSLILSALQGHAQDSDRVNVTIPFDFVVGAKLLKAGDYVVESLLDGENLQVSPNTTLWVERMISGVAFFSTKGFLGNGATFTADLNLVVQLIMGTALIVGARLAKQKRYRAHGICQTMVILLNLLMVGLVMWPSFQQQVKPALSKVLHRWYYEAAAIHAVLGITAELLGLYIVIVAGTNVLPPWLRFKHWKSWMRAELVLWALVLLSGVGTYFAWYVAPFR